MRVLNRLWRDSILIIAFALALFVFSLAAQAQVVQPSYVRPSKGAPINVFPGPEGRGLPANTATTTSAVFDFSAFDAAQISISFRDAGGTSCAGGFATWALRIYGGPDRAVVTDPLMALPLPDPNSVKTQSSALLDDQVYEVGYLPTYIAISVQTGALVAPFPASCRMMIVMTPKPFANPARAFGDGAVGDPVPPLVSGGGPRPLLIGGGDYNPSIYSGKVQLLKVDNQGRITVKPTVSTGPLFTEGAFSLVSVSNAGTGTEVFSVATAPGIGGTQTYYTGRIQNVSLQPIVCSVNAVPNAARYACAMKPMTGAAAYDGGECILPDVMGVFPVRCISLGALAGNVALYRSAYQRQSP